MSNRLFFLLAALLLAGCPPTDSTNEPTCDDGVDADEDGLSECDEEALGTDDGMADSDEDGYPDGDEVVAGTDPADEDDVIYQGGWPFNADKDSIDDPGFGSPAAEGTGLPRYVAMDQFGDEVDLFDFMGHGKPIIIDVSAEWCGPCHQMADWLDGQSELFAEYNNVREGVASGDIYWITLVVQDQNGQPADKATIDRWFERHPTERVPVLIDDRSMNDHVQASSIPSLSLVDRDGVFSVVHSQITTLARASYWLE